MDYSKNYHTSCVNNISTLSVRQHSSHNWDYVNLFYNFRNFKLSMDYLFILFTSLNFLHSSPFYAHLYSFASSHRIGLPAHFMPFYV